MSRASDRIVPLLDCRSDQSMKTTCLLPGASRLVFITTRHHQVGVMRGGVGVADLPFDEQAGMDPNRAEPRRLLWGTGIPSRHDRQVGAGLRAGLFAGGRPSIAERRLIDAARIPNRKADEWLAAAVLLDPNLVESSDRNAPQESR